MITALYMQIAMLKAKVKIEGLKELEEALKELPKATGKNVIKRALSNSADPFIDQAKALAPIHLGHLQKSITKSKVKLTSGSAGKKAFAEALAKGASRKEAGAAAHAANAEASGDVTSGLIVIGPGRHPQAIFQEFGTAHHPPKPFMRPAWEENKMPTVGNIKDELWSEIKKAAERLARKTAKLVK